MTKLGIVFLGGDSIERVASRAAQAEQAGVDSIWVAEGPLARDAFMALTAIALHTDSVQLGTGVVNPFSRHPAQLAASFATLDEASGGRAICGIGIGTRDQLENLGFDMSRPLAAMRETTEILRRLIARETLSLEGRKFQIGGNVRLGFRPPRERIPVYIGATGPKMCALTGEIADGLYVPYGTGEFLQGAIEKTLADREPDAPIDLACQIPMFVSENPEEARNGVKPGLGLVLIAPNGESVLEGNGLDPEKVEPMRDGLREGGIRGMVAAVDDDIVEALAIAGPPDECRARIEEVVALGVSHPTVSMLGEDELTLQALLGVREGVA